MPVTRRRCAGDPYGGSAPNMGCIAPPTGFFVTLAVIGPTPEPATVLVACCDAHQSVVEDWLHAVSVSEGYWCDIDVLDDPEFVREVMQDPDTFELVSLPA